MCAQDKPSAHVEWEWTYEARDKVQRVVDAANLSRAGRGHVIDRDKIRLVEREHTGGLVRRGLNRRSTFVAEDGRVDAAVEAGRALVRDSTEPVVVDSLVCGEDERVALAGEDLDLVDDEGLVVDTVDLDDGHVVTVDLEGVCRVAGEVDEAEAVAFALGDVDDGEVSSIAGGGTAQAVEQGRVLRPTAPLI